MFSQLGPGRLRMCYVWLTTQSTALSRPPERLAGLKFQLCLPIAFFSSRTCHPKFEGVSEIRMEPFSSDEIFFFHTVISTPYRFPLLHSIAHKYLKFFLANATFVGIHPSYSSFSILYFFGHSNGDFEHGGMFNHGFR